MKNKMIKSLAVTMAAAMAVTCLPSTALAAAAPAMTGPASVKAGAKATYKLTNVKKGYRAVVTVTGKGKSYVSPTAKTVSIKGKTASFAIATKSNKAAAVGKTYTVTAKVQKKVKKKWKNVKTVKKATKITYAATTALTVTPAAAQTKYKGTSYTLKATVKPAAAAKATFTSNKKAVATVTSAGKVTAKGPGTATITVKSGTKKVTRKVTVYNKVTGITISGSDHVNVGETAQLTAKVTPASGTKGSVTWKSSDTKIATVSAKGVVTGVAEGDVKITATKDGKSTTKDMHVAEKAVAVTGVALDNTAPKVGDTITAKVEPSNATNVASYAWYLNGEAVTGEVNSSYVVKTDDKGKTLKVVVTDTEGKTFESAESAAITEDKSGDVTVTDASGLQEDGTGLVGDLLRVSYGSALGTPRSITWYYNDTVVKAYTNQTGNLTDALFLATAGYEQGTVKGQAECKDGNYYAVIVNEAGTSTKSNVVSLVYDEQTAKINSFAITDDLTTMANVDHDPTDEAAVITVTMDKAYKGDFYVYGKDIVGYTDSNNIGTAVAFDPSDLKTKATEAGGKWLQVTTASKLSEKAVLEDASGAKGLAYVADDGKVTLMWKEASGNLERGSSYKVAFDQDAIDADTIGNTANKNANVSSEATLAYLPAPAKLVVKSAMEDAKAEVEILDENDAVLTYMGTTADDDKDILGFSSFVVYGDGDADTTGGTATGNSDVGDIEKGVFKTYDEVTGYDFYYAEAKTTAGVYGEKAVTIKSAAKMSSRAVASEAKITEDTTDYSKAKIALKGLAVDSTVYVYDDTYNTNATNGGFDKDNSGTYVGKVDVAAGASSAEIESVFASKRLGHDFYAVVIPKEESVVYADYKGEVFKLDRIATALEYDNKTGATIANNTTDDGFSIKSAGFQALDQFGGKITTSDANVTDKTATCTAVNTSSKNTESGTASFSVADGIASIDVVVTGTGKGIDIGDGFDVTVLGQTFKIRATQVIGTAIGTTDTDDLVDGTGNSARYAFSVKLNGTELAIALPAKVQTFTTEAEFAAVLKAATDGEIAASTITAAADGITITGNYTIPDNVTVQTDTTHGATFSGDIINNGTLKSAGTKVLAFTGDVTNNGTLVSAAATDMTFAGDLTITDDATNPTAVTLEDGANLYYQKEASAAKTVFVMDTDAQVDVGYDATHCASITKGGTATAVATGTRYDSETEPVVQAATALTIATFKIDYTTAGWLITVEA